MSYWIMGCDPLENENGEALLIVENHLELGDVWSWKTGARFTPEEADFELPVRIPFRRRRGYTGPLVDLSDIGVPFMSLRLHEALRVAGVDNIDTYAAQLESRDGQELVPCVVYNIIGCVSAMDLSRSVVLNPAGPTRGDTPIELLVLDPARIQGLNLFRLDENVSAIVVSDHVKCTVEAQGIHTLKFTRPEDWAHL